MPEPAPSSARLVELRAQLEVVGVELRGLVPGSLEQLETAWREQLGGTGPSGTGQPVAAFERVAAVIGSVSPNRGIPLPPPGRSWGS
ncbi:MAG: hypothetical protein DCF18_10095 [Cyanobium sp.]|uniref:hypothetical protein n=1 Tax=Synechococcus sp. CS-1333 TaxID=2848638 RepID=UPI000DBC397D|nr:hypothetical protein [Synechococcus sp. CS-1333]MCT0211148.1 hypothetical protein [Synechococcus sp. CS-1333]PZV22364.1 MAG: hypothetical protein DCF18_10095 [Cyanobium sp.]